MKFENLKIYKFCGSLYFTAFLGGTASRSRMDRVIEQQADSRQCDG